MPFIVPISQRAIGGTSLPVLNGQLVSCSKIKFCPEVRTASDVWIRQFCDLGFTDNMPMHQEMKECFELYYKFLLQIPVLDPFGIRYSNQWHRLALFQQTDEKNTSRL
jgi:hypothetical protein